MKNDGITNSTAPPAETLRMPTEIREPMRRLVGAAETYRFALVPEEILEHVRAVAEYCANLSQEILRLHGKVAELESIVCAAEDKHEEYEASFARLEKARDEAYALGCRAEPAHGAGFIDGLRWVQLAAMELSTPLPAMNANLRATIEAEIARRDGQD